MAARVQYQIVGRYMNNKEVTGYHLVSSENGKSARYTREQVSFLAGKGVITNCTAQIYKDKLLIRGVGCDLNSLPVQMEDGTMQRTGSVGRIKRGETAEEIMNKLNVVKAIVQGRNTVGYVVQNNGGKQVRVSRADMFKLAKEGRLGNVRYQEYNGKPILRGVGINLNELPTESIGGEQATDATQPVAKKELTSDEIHERNNKIMDKIEKSLKNVLNKDAVGDAYITNYGNRYDGVMAVVSIDKYVVQYLIGFKSTNILNLTYLGNDKHAELLNSKDITGGAAVIKDFLGQALKIIYTVNGNVLSNALEHICNDAIVQNRLNAGTCVLNNKTDESGNIKLRIAINHEDYESCYSNGTFVMSSQNGVILIKRMLNNIIEEAVVKAMSSKANNVQTMSEALGNAPGFKQLISAIKKIAEGGCQFNIDNNISDSSNLMGTAIITMQLLPNGNTYELSLTPAYSGASIGHIDPDLRLLPDRGKVASMPYLYITELEHLSSTVPAQLKIVKQLEKIKNTLNSNGINAELSGWGREGEIIGLGIQYNGYSYEFRPVGKDNHIGVYSHRTDKWYELSHNGIVSGIVNTLKNDGKLNAKLEYKTVSEIYRKAVLNAYKNYNIKQYEGTNGLDVYEDKSFIRITSGEDVYDFSITHYTSRIEYEVIREINGKTENSDRNIEITNEDTKETLTIKCNELANAMMQEVVATIQAVLING